MRVVHALLAVYGIIAAAGAIHARGTGSKGHAHLHWRAKTGLSVNYTTTQSCPFPHKRHTIEDIRAGVFPYLFGGVRKPNCSKCGASGDIADFCHFRRPREDRSTPFQHTAHLCGLPRTAEAILYFQQLGLYDLLQLTPCDLWPYLRYRTLWVIGDSQALDLHIALECFMRDFWSLDHLELIDNTAVLKDFRDLAGSSARHDIPHCAVLPEETRICFIRANMHITVLQDSMHLLRKLGLARTDDIYIVNYSHWHKEPETYESILSKFTDFVAQQRDLFKHVFWKDAVPKHFAHPDGHFDRSLGQPPFKCQPWQNVTLKRNLELHTDDPNMIVAVSGLWRNMVARNVMIRAGIPIIDTFNVTVPMWAFHRSNVGRGWECGHYCHPSAPQMWVYFTYTALQRHVQPLESASSNTTL
eukprot:jgi/Botrbrau1/15748/Bobra.4_1s0116.1